MLKSIALVFLTLIVDWVFFEFVINKPLFTESINYFLFVLLGIINLIGILFLVKQIIKYINN